MRAKSISQLYPELVAVDNLEMLLEFEFDALVVAVSVESSVGVLEKCLKRGVPVLVEKPVSLDPSILQHFSHLYSDKVRVGYNRRFYSSVERFKEEIVKESGSVQVVISELPNSSSSSSKERVNALLTNSVHVLDLLRYLFGEITLINVQKTFNANSIQSISAQIFGKTQYMGDLRVLFGVPEVYSIVYWNQGCSVELKPLEVLNKSTSLKITMPNEASPVKKYDKIMEVWNVDSKDTAAKPGFLSQYRDFFQFTLGDNGTSKLATLRDAQLAIELAMSLIRDSETNLNLSDL
jgi:predicted dehydrogenase